MLFQGFGEGTDQRSVARGEIAKRYLKHAAVGSLKFDFQPVQADDTAAQFASSIVDKLTEQFGFGRCERRCSG